jgi:probable F420-dependent oxidoreductase
MKLGVVYPQNELSGDPQSLGRLGQAVEAMGYDHLVLYDHVIGAVHEGRDPPLSGPYTQADPFIDPFAAFAYLAALTRTLKFITGVLILPQRQTVLVAKQAADVDLLSNERFRLGVGTGWNYVEYQALGEDFHKRGRKIDEQIVYLRRLWSEAAFSFKGDFHALERASLVLRPRRQIPIYVGGFVEAAYRRAARLGDGFIFVMNLADPLGDWKRLQAMLREEGRSVDGFGAQFIASRGERHQFDAPELIETALRLREAGADELTINSASRDFTEERQHVDFFAEMKAKLDAALR